MPLTGNWTLAVLSAAAFVAVVCTVVFWAHIRSWIRWPARGLMIVMCQLTACAVVAALVNDAGQFYGSWSELLGKDTGVSLGHVKAGALDRKVTAELNRQGRLGKSLLTTVYVPRAGEKKADSGLVYLPAAYFASSYQNVRFPVIELLQGFPAGPKTWTTALDLQNILDGEIASNRSYPFIAVLPVQNYLGHGRDGECVDAAHGPRVETTLTVNVRRTIENAFRVDPNRLSWAAMGYSTGGFCALNMVLRHPSMFGSAVSMSGNTHPYIDRATGDLFGHDLALQRSNDPVWCAQHSPPDVSLLIAAAHGDAGAWKDAHELAEAVRAPTQASVLFMPHGGHNWVTWQAMEAVGFDWLSRQMTPPLASPALAGGLGPVPYRTTPPPLVHRPVPPIAQSKHPPAKPGRHVAKPVRPIFQ
jgi:esterase/lipase superfamily enzyme